MNKDLIKGILILVGVVLALAIFATAATEDGVQKLSCMGRAIWHGVSLTNIHSVCGL
ncbi:hypothetical protein H3H37_17965 [Duganella sp. LX20W]|uniref:Uncharacterized protein n=1 Tax=Rugamonas brunnea TaxID=2758569 RepID=A0A7W2EUN8_9BURK|nr:hypothetical protein [Rugamonas brunnea]MBA5638949.1 hypothetical protein [Rugamonas brunnea]